jgi:hypothetical protein
LGESVEKVFHEEDVGDLAGVVAMGFGVWGLESWARGGSGEWISNRVWVIVSSREVRIQPTMSDDETRRGDDATHPKRRPPIEDNKVRAMVVGPIVYDTIRYGRSGNA